jgi:hypothetical protein
MREDGMCASENAVQREGAWWLCRSTHDDLESNAQILGGDDTQVSWAKKKTEKKQYLPSS